MQIEKLKQILNNTTVSLTFIAFTSQAQVVASTVSEFEEETFIQKYPSTHKVKKEATSLRVKRDEILKQTGALQVLSELLENENSTINDSDEVAKFQADFIKHASTTYLKEKDFTSNEIKVIRSLHKKEFDENYYGIDENLSKINPKRHRLFPLVARERKKIIQIMKKEDGLAVQHRKTTASNLERLEYETEHRKKLMQRGISIVKGASSSTSNKSLKSYFSSNSSLSSNSSSSSSIDDDENSTSNSSKSTTSSVSIKDKNPHAIVIYNPERRMVKAARPKTTRGYIAIEN
ncbi:MAG: hypothetical protein IBJ00_04150 [Alphaproteobacteria bacterium]|nr:hypothetical protein [Alphaproteobacteria bacterium]